jgi:hypothetical protein
MVFVILDLKSAIYIDYTRSFLLFNECMGSRETEFIIYVMHVGLIIKGYTRFGQMKSFFGAGGPPSRRPNMG